MATDSSSWSSGISWPDPCRSANAIKVRVCHVVFVELTAPSLLCILLFCFSSHVPLCFSWHLVFSRRCWAPSGPALQNECCSHPGEHKGERNLLTLCRGDAIMAQSDGTVRVEKSEMVVTGSTTSKSVCGISPIKGLPTQWYFFFSHRRGVLRSTLALSRQIELLTKKLLLL